MILYEFANVVIDIFFSGSDSIQVSHRSTPSAKHLHYRDAIVFRSSQ